MNSIDDGNFSPTDLSSQEIEKIQEDMVVELSPEKNRKFGEILNNFKKGTTAKQKIDGMVYNIHNFKNIYSMQWNE